jgi:hypothetical protein
MRSPPLPLLICLLLCACATTPDGQKTQAQGTGIGAVLGAIVGVAVTHDARGALIGGSVGGAGGYAYGTHVADKKAEYARREDILRASAKHAQQLSQYTERQNEYLTGEVARIGQTVQALRTQEMSAEARRSLSESARRKAGEVMGGIDYQLYQVRTEIARQQSALITEAREAQQSRQASSGEGVRLVGTAIRELESKKRALEAAKAQLQLIDPRRAY